MGFRNRHRDVYSTKGTGHWDMEENKPQIREKNFLDIDLGF